LTRGRIAIRFDITIRVNLALVRRLSILVVECGAA